MKAASFSQSNRPLTLWLDEPSLPRGRDQARLILADWLDIPQDALVLAEGPNGRPGLENHHGIDFCVSHAGRILGLAAIGLDGLAEPGTRPDPAVSPGSPGFPGLGLDLELLRTDRDFQALAQAVFSPVELEWFAGLQGDLARMTGFYRLWTWKEAWLKARGLRAWDLALAPDHPVTARESGPGPARAADGSACLEWQLTPGPDQGGENQAGEKPLQALLCLCMPPGIPVPTPLINTPTGWRLTEI